MSENEEQVEVVPVQLTELPPVTFAWAFDAVKNIMLASIAWSFIVGGIIAALWGVFYVFVSVVSR